MSVKPKDLENLETEYGEATVGRVAPENANKTYKCPCCDEETEIGEEHLVIVSIYDPEIRRHTHIECVRMFKDQNLAIKLHPNASNPIGYFKG